MAVFRDLCIITFCFYRILIPTEIICLLGLPIHGAASTKPIGKNIFKVGEEMELTCSEKYWVFGTKQKSGKIQCKWDGSRWTWESNPSCEGTVTKTKTFNIFQILLA